MSNLRIRTGRLFDGERLRTEPSIGIVIRGGRIDSITAPGESSVAAADSLEMDASGLTILPGLIDAHFHPVSASFDVASIDRTHPSLRALDARRHLESALLRGFTTVRDAIGVSGNPIEDPRLLAEPEKHLKLVIRGGEIIVNRLSESLA